MPETAASEAPVATPRYTYKRALVFPGSSFRADSRTRTCSLLVRSQMPYPSWAISALRAPNIELSGVCQGFPLFLEERFTVRRYGAGFVTAWDG